MPQIFPGFDSFPQKAKWGTLDLIYNLGIVNLRGLFTRFQAAVKDRNWQLAAAESKRTETNKRSGEISHRQGLTVRENLSVRSVPTTCGGDGRGEPLSRAIMVRKHHDLDTACTPEGSGEAGNQTAGTVWPAGGRYPL